MQSGFSLMSITFSLKQVYLFSLPKKYIFLLIWIQNFDFDSSDDLYEWIR